MPTVFLFILSHTSLVFAGTTALVTQIVTTKLVVPAGTEIIVSPVRDVFSNTVVEREIVELVVAEDVKVDGHTVIKKNAAAVARVAIAEPPGSFGRRGKLLLEVIQVTAIDGSKIDILGEHFGTAEGRASTAVIVSILTGPLGGRRIEGSPARIDAASRLRATTERETTIEVKPRETRSAPRNGVFMREFRVLVEGSGFPRQSFDTAS